MANQPTGRKNINIQLEILELELQKTDHPSFLQIEMITSETELTFAKVFEWFRKARSRKGKAPGQPETKLAPEYLSEEPIPGLTLSSTTNAETGFDPTQFIDIPAEENFLWLDNEIEFTNSNTAVDGVVFPHPFSDFSLPQVKIAEESPRLTGQQDNQISHNVPEKEHALTTIKIIRVSIGILTSHISRIGGTTRTEFIFRRVFSSMDVPNMAFAATRSFAGLRTRRDISSELMAQA